MFRDSFTILSKQYTHFPTEPTKRTVVDRGLMLTATSFCKLLKSNLSDVSTTLEANITATKVRAVTMTTNVTVCLTLSNQSTYWYLPWQTQPQVSFSNSLCFVFSTGPSIPILNDTLSLSFSLNMRRTSRPQICPFSPPDRLLVETTARHSSFQKPAGGFVRLFKLTRFIG